MKKFAFYGTLRPGESNYRGFGLKTHSNHLGTAVVPGFEMVSLGGYPMIFPTKDNKKEVIVDLIDITNTFVADGIDQMELGAGYIRKTVVIEGEEYFIYTAKTELPLDSPLRKRIIPGGDWVKYHTETGLYGKGATIVRE